MEQEKFVELVISYFTNIPGNKCKVCFKPNWEKLAIQYGHDYIDEFENGKCGYCKNKQPKRNYLYHWTADVWSKIV